MADSLGPDAQRLADHSWNRALFFTLYTLSQAPNGQASGADLNQGALRQSPRIGLSALSEAIDTGLAAGLIRSDGMLFHLTDAGLSQLNAALSRFQKNSAPAGD